METAQRDDPYAGWLFLPAAAVPERWRSRAVSMALVALLPDEVGDMLGGDVAHRLLGEDEDFLHLVAAGHSPAELARLLHLSGSSVGRRLARLRERLGVASNGELVAVLAKRGF